MVEYSSLDRYPLLPLLPFFLSSLAFSLALDYSFIFPASFRSGNFAPIKRPLVATAAVVVVVVVVSAVVVVMMMVKCTEKKSMKDDVIPCLLDAVTPTSCSYLHAASHK